MKLMIFGFATMFASAALPATSAAQESATAYIPAVRTLQAPPSVQSQLGPAEVVVNLSDRTYPLTKQTLVRAKVLNTRNGVVRDVVVETRSGVVTRFADARQLELSMWQKMHGALHHLLVEELRQVAKGSEVQAEVVVQTAPVDPFLPEGFPAERVDSAHHSYIDKKRKLNTPYVNAAVGALLRAGAQVDDVSFSPPRIRIRIDKATLESKIAFLPQAL